MVNTFSENIFTSSVKTAQHRYGSRYAQQNFDWPRSRLGDRESRFIAERDSFYQATVSESGWPYIQHRGGPKGFLKVLDEQTLGFADFSGNAQYLSVGNLNVNDRIAIILMDYPKKKRLKLWGHARIVHEHEEPGLIGQLATPSYRARIERGIIIGIEAWDWNCSQHITPRYSMQELEALGTPLLEEIRRRQSRCPATAQPSLNEEETRYDRTL